MEGDDQATFHERLFCTALPNIDTLLISKEPMVIRTLPMSNMAELWSAHKEEETIVDHGATPGGCGQ